MPKAMPDLSAMALEQLLQLRARLGDAARTAASIEAAAKKATASKLSNAERRALLKAQIEEELKP